MRRGLILGLGLLLLAGLPAPAAAQAVMTAHHHIVNVGSVSTSVRASTTARRYLLLINDSANAVFCTVDDVAAAVNTGIRLAASGTTGDRMEFTGANVPQGAVACISSTGGDRILVTEGR